MSFRQVLIPSSSDSGSVHPTPPSFFPSSIPPSPHPLPLLRAVDERHMGYLSVISSRHLFVLFLTLSSSRSLAFSNSLRLGIYFTPLKERFIRKGDLSGHVVHPWFTWFMAAMGVHLYQEGRHRWGRFTIQGTLTQILLEMVLKMQKTGPPFDVFQAFYLMAMSCTYTDTHVPAGRYFERCQGIIRTEGFRFVDPNWADVSSRVSPSAFTEDHLSEYTEGKHELVSILANLMYLQCIHCMLYNECHGLFADLEAQLPEFAVRFPPLCGHRGTLLKCHFTAGLSRGF